MAKSKKVKVEDPNLINRLATRTKITGDISSDSCVRVDGEILGNLNCKSRLILGKEGCIEGNIQVVEAEVNGRVIGNVYVAELLILSNTSIINGDVRAERIVIEDGAQISGKIEIGKNSAPEATKKSKTKTEEEPDLVY